MTRRHLGPARLLILAVLGGRAVAQPAPAARAPALVVPQLDGARFDLAALRGKVVIVNFWATWCAPCRSEMPALDAVYARFRERGLEMIGISVDRRRDRKAVGKAARALRYPVAMLDEAETNGFGKPAVVPSTFVVDRAGIVCVVLIPKSGAMTEESLERVLSPLLRVDPGSL